MKIIARYVILVLLAIVIISGGKAEEDDDEITLLEFKQSLIDSQQQLKDWNSSNTKHFCNWTGITCSSSSSNNSNNNTTNNTTADYSVTVTGIDLTSLQLNGTISMAISKLRSLKSLKLGDNNLQEEFPYTLLSCSKLSYLDLSQNYFWGQLPKNISHLTSTLTHLDLTGNNFQGNIPQDFGKLRKLRVLNLSGNLITGPLPAELGNITTLQILSIAWNPFKPSQIPVELGYLTNLEFLYLAGCQLTGNIPVELGALKRLDYLDISTNKLSGNIPPQLMFLPKLTRLEAYANKLSGQIPREISNLVSLTELDLSTNFLDGSIPVEIAELQHLRILQLYDNQLTGEIPAQLEKLEKLRNLVLYKNRLTGGIPQEFGKYSRLRLFDVSSNLLTGKVPPYVCDAGQLMNFTLFNNKLTGEIPQQYGTCRSLVRFQVYSNKLEGEIPVGVWSSPNISVLNLAHNNFTGTLSSTIGNALHLATLHLDNNQFTGNLPQEVGTLPKLHQFTASQNRFSGSIPFGNCSSLESLDLSHNTLSAIPIQIANCKQLAVLDLSENNLSGSIPLQIGLLAKLNSLDLSQNHFDGIIPPQFGSLLLSHINISYNNLQGPIPANWESSMAPESFTGNPGLCGDNLPNRCTSVTMTRRQKTKSNSNNIWISVLAIFGALSGLVFAGRCIYRQRNKYTSVSPVWKTKSFQRLSFNELDVVEKLEDKNVIGSGYSGKVYKVTFLSGESVAVKQILRVDNMHNFKSDEEFRTEIEILGKIRHRNVVKLLGCCCNKDCDLLIYEHMINGSLGDVLHGQKQKYLDWTTRLNIAVGAAQGLSYLHHDCYPAILHRDIKANNILLDANYDAKIADFGLAKLLNGENHTATQVAGSYGYIAPEYAYTFRVSEKSDVYSFGVVLLELLTEKRPIEPEIEHDVDLVKWVRRKVNTKVDLEDFVGKFCAKQDQTLMFLRVALLCTSTAPAARPSMRQVVLMLQQIQLKLDVSEDKLDLVTLLP